MFVWKLHNVDLTNQPKEALHVRDPVQFSQIECCDHALRASLLIYADAAAPFWDCLIVGSFIDY